MSSSNDVNNYIQDIEDQYQLLLGYLGGIGEDQTQINQFQSKIDAKTHTKVRHTHHEKTAGGEKTVTVYTYQTVTVNKYSPTQIAAWKNDIALLEQAQSGLQQQFGQSSQAMQQLGQTLLSLLGLANSSQAGEQEVGPDLNQIAEFLQQLFQQLQEKAYPEFANDIRSLFPSRESTNASSAQTGDSKGSSSASGLPQPAAKENGNIPVPAATQPASSQSGNVPAPVFQPAALLSALFTILGIESEAPHVAASPVVPVTVSSAGKETPSEDALVNFIDELRNELLSIVALLAKAFSPATLPQETPAARPAPLPFTEKQSALLSVLVSAFGLPQASSPERQTAASTAFVLPETRTETAPVSAPVAVPSAPSAPVAQQIAAPTVPVFFADPAVPVVEKQAVVALLFVSVLALALPKQENGTPSQPISTTPTIARETGPVSSFAPVALGTPLAPAVHPATEPVYAAIAPVVERTVAEVAEFVVSGLTGVSPAPATVQAAAQTIRSVAVQTVAEVLQQVDAPKEQPEEAVLAAPVVAVVEKAVAQAIPQAAALLVVFGKTDGLTPAQSAALNAAAKVVARDTVQATSQKEEETAESAPVPGVVLPVQTGTEQTAGTETTLPHANMQQFVQVLNEVVNSGVLSQLVVEGSFGSFVRTGTLLQSLLTGTPVVPATGTSSGTIAVEVQEISDSHSLGAVNYLQADGVKQKLEEAPLNDEEPAQESEEGESQALVNSNRLVFAV